METTRTCERNEACCTRAALGNIAAPKINVMSSRGHIYSSTETSTSQIARRTAPHLNNFELGSNPLGLSSIRFRSRLLISTTPIGPAASKPHDQEGED